jgi:AcrR family transcriptional regulator
MARTPKITNEEILAAAREVFLAQGFGASTLEIAERAGISEASIFKRFTTKQALFLAAIGITETPKLLKSLSSKVPTANIKAEITDICDEMLAFYLEVMPRVMMMMTPNNLPPLIQSPPPPIRDSLLLAEFLERAIQQGYLRSSCNASTVASMIVGAINNYVATQHIAAHQITNTPLSTTFKHQSITPAQFSQHLIETLWQGITPE